MSSGPENDVFTLMTTGPLKVLFFVLLLVIPIRFFVVSRRFYKSVWKQPKDLKHNSPTSRIGKFRKMAHNTGMFHMWFSCLLAWTPAWFVAFFILVFTPNWAESTLDEHAPGVFAATLKLVTIAVCMLGSLYGLWASLVTVYEPSRAARVRATIGLIILAFTVANFGLIIEFVST